MVVATGLPAGGRRLRRRPRQHLAVPVHGRCQWRRRLCARLPGCDIRPGLTRTARRADGGQAGRRSAAGRPCEFGPGIGALGAMAMDGRFARRGRRAAGTRLLLRRRRLDDGVFIQGNHRSLAEPRCGAIGARVYRDGRHPRPDPALVRRLHGTDDLHFLAGSARRNRARRESDDADSVHYARRDGVLCELRWRLRSGFAFPVRAGLQQDRR